MAFTTKLLLPAILLFALCLVGKNEAQQCTTSATATTCSLPVTLYDHAPDHMAHGRFNPAWWWVTPFYDNPLNGSCGTANNSMGWSNSDFELPLYILQNIPCCNMAPPIINGESGLVGGLCTAADGSDTTCGRLGPDRTPQYAYGNNPSPLGQVSSAASFYTFFHPVQQTVAVNYNLTLTASPTVPGLRTFYNFSFFPLDGIGWGDWGVKNMPHGGVQYHNFAFCMVVNTHFTYSGGEYFFFLGDDDVYAYVNNFLVLDLGGVHQALNQTIRTDSLGLTKGVSYRFDLFYCERHTISSEMAFDTTISFFCPYVDWCGQCSGDGSSCCDGKCNDNNPCTIDSCTYLAPPAGCNNTNVTCPPSTPCLLSYCNMSTGACSTSQVNCDDGNACTKDTCGAAGCSHVQLNCDSPNQCLITGCNNATGCTAVPVSCPQTNLCVNNTCSPSAGCVAITLPCQSFNACESASCTASKGCVITPNPPCSGGNMCTNSFCSATGGCQYPPKNITAMCGASTQCRTVTCNPTSGCNVTSTAGRCVPPDACHTAYCDDNLGCQYPSNHSCNGDACGTSTCNPTTGTCVYVPKAPCAAGPACTNATCDKVFGCITPPITCPPPVNCTQYTCNPKTNACQASNITGTATCGPCGGAFCSTADPCNPQVCVNGACQTQPYTCNSGSACIKESCYNNNGQPACNKTFVQCTQGDACHPQTCNSATGLCEFANNVTCSTPNLCNTGQCVVLPGANNFTCAYSLVECYSADQFCHPVVCQGGVCVNGTAPTCSDGNSCTLDICSNGTCSNPPVCTDPGTLCDPIVCVNGQCVPQPVNCSTDNLCILNSCNPATGQCDYQSKDCNGTTCNPSSCNPATGLCVIPPLLNCNDDNPCTLDQVVCNEGTGFSCNNTDISYECDSHTACILDFCNSSAPVQNVSEACYHTPLSCASTSICTVVTGCNATTGCTFGPKICPQPANWCEVSFCDEVAGCLSAARACAPEDNYCFQGTCNNVSKTCGQQQRPNWQTITNQNGVTCLLVYNTAAKAGLTAGVIAAIVIAAVVAAALIAIAGKKGVDIFMASRGGPIGAAHTSPLYEQAAGTGNNPLYGGK